MKRGYYLIRSSDQSQHWVSDTVNPSALERVADRVLGGRHGYGYTVRFYHGPLVDGRPHWSYGQCERFMDALMASEN